MTDLSPSSTTAAPRSLWKPIAFTLLATFFLAFSTCAGGFAMGNRPRGIGVVLLYAGLFFTGLFLLALFFAAIYFIIWLVQKSGSQ
jgi:hypothetical protein